MKRFAVILGLLLTIFSSNSAIYQPASVNVELEQLSDDLFLDTTLIPSGFDNDTLVRLYDFLETHVRPDCRTPFPEQYIYQLPVILRYVLFTDAGKFPVATEGFAGLCDMVSLQCAETDCEISLSEGEEQAFLILVAIPDDEDETGYLIELWGITAHEIAHTFGAIDGPHCPFYEPDKLLAPIACESDTYYWFGIAHVFEPGWQGVIKDAWLDDCEDEICDALRRDVFMLDKIN